MTWEQHLVVWALAVLAVTVAGLALAYTVGGL